MYIFINMEDRIDRILAGRSLRMLFQWDGGRDQVRGDAPGNVLEQTWKSDRTSYTERIL